MADIWFIPSGVIKHGVLEKNPIDGGFVGKITHKWLENQTLNMAGNGKWTIEISDVPL